MSLDEDVSVGYAGTFEGQGFPCKLSVDAIDLCQVEWSFTPTNGRKDHYFLDFFDGCWTLWLTYFDDNEERITSDIIGVIRKGDVPVEIAAKLLLRDFWRYDNIMCFDAIVANKMEYADVSAVAKEVWGKNSLH